VPGWLKTTLIAVACFLAGAVPAFFLGGPAFFADGPFAERLVALAIYAIAVLLLGLAAGWFWPGRARVTGNALAVPVLPVVVLLTEWAKTDMAALSVGFTLAGFTCGLAGAVLGARLRGRTRRSTG